MRGRQLRRVAVVTVVLGVAACSGDGDSGSPTDTGDGPSVTEERSEVQAPEVPPAPPAGAGVLVLGEQHRFDVTSCRLEPDESEPAGARTLLAASGAGTAASGVEFTVEVQRFVTGADVLTYTDTITYEDGARILQAQRVEVAGQVTDLRAPDASSPLVHPRDDGLFASGIAGPPGGSPDEAEGYVGIALSLTCP